MSRVRVLTLVAAALALLALALTAPMTATADASMALSEAYTTAELVDNISETQLLEITTDAEAEMETEAEAEAEADAEADADAEAQTEAEAEMEAESEVDAEAELEAEMDVEDDGAFAETESESSPLLADGVWRHEPLEARSMIQHSAQATQAKHYPDDGRHGLSTKGSATAHYATLRLDNTWDRSHKYCASVGGSLCKVSQICPKGKGHAAVGAKEIPHNRRSWSPVADAPNMWVNMEPGPYGGPADRCATAAGPAWGSTAKTLKEINKDWENHSKSLVACCDASGVMKAFLRPGAKAPGSGRKGRKGSKGGKGGKGKRGGKGAKKGGKTADSRDVKAILDAEEKRTNEEVGMIELIKRGRITTSTDWRVDHGVKGCALKSSAPAGQSSHSWCSKDLNTEQWIQADLGRPRRILSIATQGRGDIAQWLQSYRLQYRNSADEAWKRVPRTFTANTDQTTVVRHPLRADDITARYVRLLPQTWHNHISLRWDIGYTSAHTDGAAEKKRDDQAAKLDELEKNADDDIAMTRLIARGAVTSSSDWRVDHGVRGSALKSSPPAGQASHAWCAKDLNTEQFIQVDLSRPRRILGIATQGRGDYAQWVTSYKIQHRNSAEEEWKAVPRSFLGNIDQTTVVRHSLRGDEITARYVRLQPTAWHGHISMRWDVDYTSEHTDGAKERAADGKQAKLDEAERLADADVAMTRLIARGAVSSSTDWHASHDVRFSALRSAAAPGNSHAWCSKVLDINQWIQADLGKPRRLFGIATQGRGDYAQWVTSYALQHRNSAAEEWKRVPRTFQANIDQHTVARHSLRNDDITARYVRLQPLAWHGHISMRWEIDYQE